MERIIKYKVFDKIFDTYSEAKKYEEEHNYDFLPTSLLQSKIALIHNKLSYFEKLISKERKRLFALTREDKNRIEFNSERYTILSMIYKYKVSVNKDIKLLKQYKEQFYKKLKEEKR